MEFKNKKVARSVAEMLNAQPIGGKKGTRWRDDVWTMKYLPKFKWSMLTEQIGKSSEPVYILKLMPLRLQPMKPPCTPRNCGWNCRSPNGSSSNTSATSNSHASSINVLTENVPKERIQHSLLCPRSLRNASGLRRKGSGRRRGRRWWKIERMRGNVDNSTMSWVAYFERIHACLPAVFNERTVQWSCTSVGQAPLSEFEVAGGRTRPELSLSSSRTPSSTVSATVRTSSSSSCRDPKRSVSSCSPTLSRRL